MPEYVIITPVRNEGQYIEQTVKSVITQTILPKEWIIVNDGSIDDTAEIITNYAYKYSWMKIVHRKDRGYRKSGKGVMEAFFQGYNNLKFKNYDFIIKLDGDLTFNPEYFEKCFQYFSEDQQLGIAGGTVYNDVNGTLICEKNPRFHVRGATKIYKRECWQSIYDLLNTTGWDTIDEVKANMLGYKTKTFPDLKVIQLKNTGIVDGIWRSWIKNGRANYIAGYHPIFMIMKCIRRIFTKPIIVSSMALFIGYVSGYIKKIPQVDDRGLIQYIRKNQMRKLLFKESMWN